MRRWTEDSVVSTLRAAGCAFAEDEARLLLEAGTSPAMLTGMIERRVAGFPLEHILGWVDFHGLRFAVGDGVFVPRRRSELMVREVCAAAASGSIVVDLCCGCGALGAAVAASVAGVEVHAADIDPVAADYARRNLSGYSAQVHVGDLFDALPGRLRGRVDILLCNAPYVPGEEWRTLPPEARLHEPRRALDGGDDGLVVQRRVVSQVTDWLSPGGCVVFEVSARQAPEALGLMQGAGLRARVATAAELSATVVVGTGPDDHRGGGAGPHP
ncbi:putative protein N(5)-glutamine methyltransferase [Rhodococcus triatomae]|uniref:peptide chain release factor N(5)-glutamine methyltransferase n=1 Tax=Rhodococcus triatomae TaxID=300028 RepID=A0A1G8P0N3_9NOCA|nr:putative protein N(5)-glutamine methyltransferase [Rhodococcus triatomae]QNG18779.1 putative protein N(5)-glutamine methyltransferase [Rhodococcus triatomae]QNG25310.1 putative protein N(5)-glutamine methyltransferase [Rhodococcus triatomae]SDI86111.1 release factor glutamine methyltransferase [Rhodococcus triatomae]